MSSERRIGITMGDPAGVGPEIIVKALQEMSARDGSLGFVPIVYGVPQIMAAAATALGGHIEFVESQATQSWPRVNTVEVARPTRPIPIGTVDAEAGRIAYASVERAIRDAMAGAIEAIVTAPISKEAINLAGYAYAGHTDMLADLTGSPDSCMMLAHGALRVSHVSTHVALSKVPELVTERRLGRVLDLTLAALARFGIAKPRIGVAALNPHAGEGGLFGHEDANVIAPTVQGFRDRGFDVSGPISGDTVFVRALGNEFDAVIAMFHDQGHIPLKLIGFRVNPADGKWNALSGVNVTLGLPFVRTSVDHGTAFDIAGKGVALAQSMIEAIDMALSMAA